jgi:hypothetical protein
MKTKEAIEHFGSVPALAAALGMRSRQAVYYWGEYPTPGRQYQIEVLTNGALRAEREPQPEQAAA